MSQICHSNRQNTLPPSLDAEIEEYLDSGCHMTSLIQGLSPRQQGRKRREGLGMRLRGKEGMGTWVY